MYIHTHFHASLSPSLEYAAGAFANGDWYGSHWTFQPEIGRFNEESFQRLDYVIARGGQLGIRFILALVNFCA